MLLRYPCRIQPPKSFPFEPFAVKRALEEAKMEAVDIDGIAFTRGPGEALAKIETIRSDRPI